MFDGFQVVAEGLQFPEGPVALSDGSVLVVEIRRGTVSRVAPSGSVDVVADCGGGPNGSAIGPDGQLYVANNGGFGWVRHGDQWLPRGTPEGYTGGSIQRVDLQTGRVLTLYVSCGEKPLRGPNDLIFDDDGGFYFTDHGKSSDDHVDVGALYYASAAGDRIIRLVQGLHGPNGIGISPDGSKLYVSETPTGRLWWWEIVAPGTIRGGRTPMGTGGGNFLFGSSDFAMFDSLAIDSVGNICVGTLGKGGISVISPEGVLDEFIPNEEDPATTNICFGGDDLCTAFVTSSRTGRLLRTTWDRPGLQLAFSG